MWDPVGARFPRWIGTIAAAAMAASAIVFNPLAAGASATVIDEFPTLTGGSTPNAIVTGADGNLWFTESTAGSRIGQITPRGEVHEFTGLTSSPFWITSGPDGNLWVTEPGANAIGELSSGGAFVGEFTVPTSGSNPDQIALGPDGNLWFTENVGNQIGKITPDGTITEYPIPSASSVPPGPSAIVAGPDGNLWFTEQSSNRIGQITTGGAITEFGSVGSTPGGMAAGPDGNVWFTEFYGNQIGRITPVGEIVEFAVTAGSEPASIATGPDGNLWFTEYLGNKIGRMSPDGVMLAEFPIPTLSSAPNGITTGPDGNLWFTESSASQIGRLTLGTGADPTALTYDGATTGDFNDPATVSATLADISTTPSTPLSGQKVVFTLNGAETCSGVTDASGHASCQLTPAETSGTYTVAANFAGTPALEASSASGSFVVNAEETALTYDGATTGDFNDPATVSATLADTSTTPSTPVSDQKVVFSLNGAETCSGVTDASGHASCQLTPAETSGTYTVAANFAGTLALEASSASGSFVVTAEETALTLTAPAAIANGSPVTLNAVLATDGAPLAGRTITLGLGTGSSAQQCTATTNGAGSATCSIAAVNQTLGDGGLFATFAGDGFYAPASAGGASVIFAFVSGGMFVIGDGSAHVGGAVTFWSSKWADSNTMSGWSGAASFKGFAPTTTPTCGGTWTSTTGNSSNPPAGPLPTYMAVVVTSSLDKSGSTVTGKITRIVIVKTDSGYSPDPGGTGTGTVVAVLCSA